MITSPGDLTVTLIFHVLYVINTCQTHPFVPSRYFTVPSKTVTPFGSFVRLPTTVISFVRMVGMT